jgi:peptidoglycan/LPS O-acetylase OafA/YrhL
MPDPHSSPASRLLDVLRGVAALLVLIGHSRGHLADAAGVDPTGSSAAERLLLAPTGVSMEAVAFFFMLSGYLVGGQVLRQCREDRFEWAEFLGKRLSRLWTVLLPGLVVTGVVVAAGRSVIAPPVQALWRANDDSVGLAACNAAFLQKSRCDTYSVNEALWSLSYEFWFYVVFAAAVAAWFAARRGRERTFVSNVLVLVGALALFGPHLLWLAPAWLLGAVVATIPAPYADRAQRRLGPGALLGALLSLGAAMLASTLLGLGRPALMLLVGVPAAVVVLLASLVRHEHRALRPLVSAGAALGRVSFSLYVFHLPFVAVGAAVAAHMGVTSTVGLPAATYGLATLVLPLMWCFWWSTERHTAQVRALVLRRLVRRRPATSLMPGDDLPDPISARSR